MSHHYRPRAPSYTGLPPSSLGHPKPTPSHPIPHHSHHHHLTPNPTPPTSGSPSDYTTPIAYTTHSPVASYHRAPPSISTSSLSSSSYAGSDGEEYGMGGGVGGRGGRDVVDVLTGRMEEVFDPLVLDRVLVGQAQTSGMLNAKSRELLAVQEEAQMKLAETRRALLEGMRAAKEVKTDLEYVHRKVKSLKQRTERKYPVEYNMARERLPPPC